MIKIIGTSHISPESLKEIQRVIKKEKPDCVAVELDPMRYEAIRRGEKVTLASVKHIGFRNYFIAKILSIIQNYLGKKTGVMPGTEMLIAVNTAHEVQADVAFIDQDIRKTLNGLRAMKFSEKFKIFLSIFKKVPIDEKFELNKVPSEKLVEQMIMYLKEASPTLYKVLIVQRNLHMARALTKLDKRYKKIVAVVGAGHEKGIKKSMKLVKSQTEGIIKYRAKKGGEFYGAFAS
jgi:pheromone shutdown-related protein TraB